MPFTATVVDVPANLTIQSAPDLLRSAGLAPGTFRCASISGTPGAKVGRVMAFSPTPGTTLPRGSKVDMFAVLPKACHQFASSMAITRFLRLSLAKDCRGCSHKTAQMFCALCGPFCALLWLPAAASAELRGQF